MDQHDNTNDIDEAEFERLMGEMMGGPSAPPVLGKLDERKLLDLLARVLAAALEASSDREQYTEAQADLFLAGVSLVIQAIADNVLKGKLF